jgi:hypothetical protein
VPCAFTNPGSNPVATTKPITNIRRIMLFSSLKHAPHGNKKGKRRNSDRRDKD